MYKINRNLQITLSDFNQPMGMKMNADNRWVKKAEVIPWEKIEERYAKLFPSKTGMPAKPLRMALGSLLIQKQYATPMRNLWNSSVKIHTISILSECPDMRTNIRLCHHCLSSSENVFPRKFSSRSTRS